MSFTQPLPKSGYFAVIFSSTKSGELEGYEEMDRELMELAACQPGYLGHESLSNQEKTIFVSYWQSREAIESWRTNSTHKMAKTQAKKWYKRYLSQICYVESSNLFET